VVRRKADVCAVDKDIEVRDSHQYEVTRVSSGEVEEQMGQRFGQETEDEERGTLRKMNTTEKSGEADVTSRRSIFVQIDEAENQIVVTENQMVDTELEEDGRAILGKVSVKDDQNVVKHMALLEPVLDQPGVSELQNNERENEGEEDGLDGTEMDMDKGMRREDREREASAKGKEYKEEMREGEGDKEQEEKVRKENKGERREEEGEREPVPPVWDTVLVQHGDVQGTQV